MSISRILELSGLPKTAKKYRDFDQAIKEIGEYRERLAETDVLLRELCVAPLSEKKRIVTEIDELWAKDNDARIEQSLRVEEGAKPRHHFQRHMRSRIEGWGGLT